PPALRRLGLRDRKFASFASMEQSVRPERADSSGLSATRTTLYRVGDLLIDSERCRVTRDGCEISLGKVSFDLLLALVRSAPRFASTDSLMDQVWEGTVVGPETLSQRVKLLRTALGDDAKEPRYIAGVRGRGYRIVAPVAPYISPPSESSKAIRAGSDAAHGATSTTGAHSTRPSEVAPEPTLVPGTSGSRRIFAVKALAVLLVVVLVALFASRELRESATRPPLASRAELPSSDTPLVAPAASVAVVPFVNLTGEPAKEYFSDGMAEELINELSRVPGLKVPARTSSFAYKGRNVDIRRIGHDLGVTTVLEGSVRGVGDHIRVTAQMVNAENGYHLWSQTYDREFGDVFKLQDELAGQIVTALKESMHADLPADVMSDSPTSDPEAYRFYLQSEAAADTQAALRLNARALARDPKF